MKQIKWDDAQDYISVLSVQAGVVKQKIEFALCREKASKDFSSMDKIDRDFDVIRKRMEREGKFDPYKFPADDNTASD